MSKKFDRADEFRYLRKIPFSLHISVWVEALQGMQVEQVMKILGLIWTGRLFMTSSTEQLVPICSRQMKVGGQCELHALIRIKILEASVEI